MIIFDGSELQYEIIWTDHENQIARVRDNFSKMIFEGVISSFEVNRDFPFSATFGPLVARKVVGDVHIEMIKVLRVKQ